MMEAAAEVALRDRKRLPAKAIARALFIAKMVATRIVISISSLGQRFREGS